MGASFTGFLQGANKGIKEAEGGGSSDSEGGGGLIKKIASPSEYKRGGKVKRSGRAKVHRGERVLTKSQAKRYERKHGGRK